MGLFDGGVVKLTNFAFRVLQLLIAIPILAIYANQVMFVNGLNQENQGQRTEQFLWRRDAGKTLNLGIAAGVIGMVTALVYMGLIFFVDFVYICYAGAWDLIVMILYAALYGQMRSLFRPGDKSYQDGIKRNLNKDRVDLMVDACWIDLVAMLLWLITFLMAVVTLVLSRFRGSKVVS